MKTVPIVIYDKDGNRNIVGEAEIDETNLIHCFGDTECSISDENVIVTAIRTDEKTLQSLFPDVLKNVSIQYED